MMTSIHSMIHHTRRHFEGLLLELLMEEEYLWKQFLSLVAQKCLLENRFQQTAKEKSYRNIAEKCGVVGT